MKPLDVSDERCCITLDDRSPSSDLDDTKASRSMPTNARDFSQRRGPSVLAKLAQRKNTEKRAASSLVNGSIRVNRGYRAPPIVPVVLRFPTLCESTCGIRPYTFLPVPPRRPSTSARFPRGSHLAGSILLHSRRGLSPKDERLYKRDTCCLKHVRRNRTGASRTGRVAAASRAHLLSLQFPCIIIIPHRTTCTRSSERERER